MGRYLFFVSVWMMLGYACIRSEALNAEADIDSCFLANEHIKGLPVITNDRVVFMAMPSIDRSALAPTFKLTPGATIDPAGDTPRDFNSPQQYRVTSEDRQWQKRYTVVVDTADLRTKYHFEHYEKPEKSKYHLFFEMVTVTDPSGETYQVRQEMWASANAGFSMTGMGREPDDFPTANVAEGKSGRGVRLQTRSTGAFGAALASPKPIAAGNLFIGSFDALKAMGNHLEATHFGLPFGKEPVKVTGWYRYKAGSVFTDRQKNEIAGRRDQGNITALFYETDDALKYLDGNTIKGHPNILARAEAATAADFEWKESDEWVYFEIPFDYAGEVDQEKLKSYRYNLALVFTSSRGGDVFEGAVGSTLCIDEVEVVCK